MSTVAKNDKKVKVKFNTNTAIILNPNLTDFCDASEKIKGQFFNPAAYKPVSIGQIEEITEEQYNFQFKDRNITLPTGKFGNLKDQITKLRDQFKGSFDKYDASIEKQFVKNVTVPICEIVA